MEKQNIEKVFESKLSRLSNRAKFILQNLKLDKFDSFFNFFVEQNKRVDFGQRRNCGHKTGKDLNNFIKSIAELSTDELLDKKENKIAFSKETELLFDRHFDELSTRTKNILCGFEANHIDGFDEKILRNNAVFNIGKLRNCGTKSYEEILDLKEKISKIINYSISADLSSELLSAESKSEYNLSNKKSIQPIFNQRDELRFNERFEGLQNRTKNVLQDLGANNIQSFHEKFLSCDDFILNGIKNCGARTSTEIEEFKKEISLVFKLNKNEPEVLGLFKNIEVYFFETKVFNQVELDIIFSYYQLVRDKHELSLDQISNKSNLTKERVRQISVRLLDKISNYIYKIIEKGNNETSRYFKDEYFIVNEQMTDWINKTEDTHFNPSFIAYVLKHVNNKEYDFFCRNQNLRFYSGAFIKRSLQFDFAKCFKFLQPYIDIKRKEDVAIKIDELIKLFKQPKNNTLFSKTDNLNLIDRMQILGVLKLITENISDPYNDIELTSDLIIIKRNTKKLKHEFIVDILNECKKPMHFTELYEECLRRQIKVTSALSIHGMMQHYPEIFGLKGQGMYGLKEWGGRFGTIGDVAEQIIKEKNHPIDRRELINTLCRELYVSQDSISTVLFFYEPEKRFIKLKNDRVGLREWLSK